MVDSKCRIAFASTPHIQNNSGRRCSKSKNLNQWPVRNIHNDYSCRILRNPHIHNTARSGCIRCNPRNPYNKKSDDCNSNPQTGNSQMSYNSCGSFPCIGKKGCFHFEHIEGQCAVFEDGAVQIVENNSYVKRFKSPTF